MSNNTAKSSAKESSSSNKGGGGAKKSGSGSDSGSGSSGSGSSGSLEGDLITMIGPYICYKYNLPGMNIVLFGESHGKITKIEGVYFHKYLLGISRMAQKKNKCVDIYFEYEYPVALLQEKEQKSDTYIKSECSPIYKGKEQYIVWMDEFFQACVIGKSHIRLHSFDLRKLYTENYMLNDLFKYFVVGDIKYKLVGQITGFKEFDPTNKYVLAFMGKTIDEIYFENKDEFDVYKKTFRDNLDKLNMDKDTIKRILYYLLKLEEDDQVSELFDSLQKLFNYAKELTIFYNDIVTINDPIYIRAVEIIKKQITKTMNKNIAKKQLLKIIVEGFTHYFEEFLTEKLGVINIMNNEPKNKILIILLIYLHLLTDIYTFFRIISKWSTTQSKLLRKKGCTDENYNQKNVFVYGGANHIELLNRFIMMYFKNEPVRYKTTENNQRATNISNFPKTIQLY
jgi:hypothetical protein